MKTRVIHHLILNSGRSQFSPLKDQSRHDLKQTRMLIRCGGLQTPWNLCGFEFHLHQKGGWAHVEARSHDVLVLESFTAGDTNGTACWRACTEHFRHLTSCGLVQHLPVTLVKPASNPWCASLFPLGFESLSEGEIRTLARLIRTIAWAVFFEFRSDGADPAQVGAWVLHPHSPSRPNTQDKS